MSQDNHTSVLSNDRKWFIDFPYIEFEKTIEGLDEIDSVDTLQDRCRNFFGISPDEELDLPETDEERYQYGSLLSYYGFFDEAAVLIRPLAESGHASSQYMYARMCYRGKGAPQSFADSVMWMERAAGQHHYPAMRHLLACYRQGDSIIFRDDNEWWEKYRSSTPEERGKSDTKYKEFLGEFEKIAEENEEARFILEFNRRSLSEYTEFLREESERGSAEATSRLASGSLDDEERYLLYRKAAEMGDTDGLIYRYLNCVFYEDREPTFGEAEGWLLKAAEDPKGVGARIHLGALYLREHVEGGRKDDNSSLYGSAEEAVRWLRTEKWNPLAQYFLGMAYYFGYGVERSEEKAREWFGRSSDGWDYWYDLEYGDYAPSSLKILEIEDPEEQRMTMIALLKDSFKGIMGTSVDV